jgi:uncharacterized protein (TIGR03000 family)
MYSVILAALVTTGVEQSQGWHHCHGCYSCHCSCSCYSGCGGYAYWPSCSCSCYGCSCSSCYCSCSCSCSCYSGCSCSCSGPALWTVGYSHWCTGCYGSWCSGYACTGWTYYSGPTHAGGVCAGDVLYGSIGSAPSGFAQVGTPAPAIARAPAAPVAPTAPATQTVATRGSATAAAAKVVVNIPADSKLWVEEVACPLKGETRSFSTAVLEPGSRYFYNLTAESAQGARETRRIELMPGQTTEVDFKIVTSVKR